MPKKEAGSGFSISVSVWDSDFRDWVGSIVAYPGEISNTPFRIGAQSKSLSGFFHGTIDEVRVYNRAFSAEEIMALMAD